MATDNMSLHYTESGNGAPVVLLDWTPWHAPVLADALASRYSVFDIDPPGTASPPEDVAVAVAETARAAGLASYALVGTSTGANVAFLHALLFPDSVSALALVSPTCVEPTAPRPRNTPELAGDMLAHPENAESPQPDAERTALLSSLAQRWRAAGIDASGRLHELNCATLVVFGQEDRLVSREAGGIWKAQAPNCSLSYVYDAGHAIAVDRPSALTNVVLDFIERRETFIVENRTGVINP